MRVTERRLRNQQLVGVKAQSAQELVRHFGAVQGQEYSPTKWGLGLRLTKSGDAGIEAELECGQIVRTHLLRPTWHLVASEDLRWLLQLTAPRVHQLNGTMYRNMQLDGAAFRKYNRLIEKALEGGAHRTREELQAVFAKGGVGTEGVRLGLVMMQAELEGIVCSGKRRGNQQTYALLDERVPAGRAWSTEEALVELTRRYFQSRGPATAHDFARRSSLTLSDCRRGIGMLQPELVQSDRDGAKYFYFEDEREADARASLHLLPIYDEYLIGYADRSEQLRLRKSLGDPAFRFDSMIVHRGEIVGTWRREMNKGSIDVVWDSFQPPTREQIRLLEKAAQRFGEFHGLPVALHKFDASSTSKMHRAGWAFSNAAKG